MKLMIKLRTAAVVCIALAVVLFGMLPDVSRADDKTPSPTWPEKGGVDFQVSYGKGGLVIGQARYSWAHDGQKYRKQLALQTTGVVAVVHKLDYVQTSQGSIGENGLTPVRFDVAHQGKAPEMALFDWNGESGARVSIRRGERERHNLELTPGDQDVLSIWRQIGHVDTLPDSLLIVANKSARRARIVKLEEVEVSVPAGRFMTRHFSARSEDGRLKIDLWLANTHHRIPVRAILGDDKSDTLVLEATAIRIPSSD